MKKYSLITAVISIFILLLAVAPAFAQEGTFVAETTSNVLHYDAPTSIELSAVKVGTESVNWIYGIHAVLLFSAVVCVWKFYTDSSLHSLKMKLRKQSDQ